MSNSSNSQSSSVFHLARIPALDGWRGLSILLVILGHLVNWRFSPLEAGNFPSASAAYGAILGVKIFFVISGFIITRMSLLEKNRPGDYAVVRFYIRRIFRIVPAFLFYLACVYGLSHYGLISQDAQDTLRAATFTCNLPDVSCGWFAGHTWTLAYEQQFYLVFPLIFFLLPLKPSKLFLMLSLLLTACSFSLSFFDLETTWSAVRDFSKMFSFITVGAVFAFHESRIVELSASRYAKSFTIFAIAVLLFGAVLTELEEGRPMVAYLNAALETGLAPLSVAWLVVSSLYQRNLATRLLELQLIQFMGAISYSLYLWQELFAGHRTAYLTDSFLTLPILMLPAAILSYFYIEKPFIRLGKYLLVKRTKCVIQ